MGAVLVAVPMGSPFFGFLLEDVLAVWAEYVVSETEVLVEHHGSPGDPLRAVLALLFVWAAHFHVFVEDDWVLD